MKVGIIRGPFLNKWEMQTFEFLPNYEIDVVGIAPKEHFYNIQSINFPIILTHQLGYFNRIPYLKLLIQEQFGLDYYLMDFKKITKDMDLLHTAETFHIFTNQALKTGKPTIITTWENIPFNGYKKPFLKNIKYSFEKANHFIAITNLSKKVLIIEGVSENKISVIPCGVDVEKFKPKSKNSKLYKLLNIPETSKIILFVGRLVWEKGIYCLIYAFNDLLKKYKNLILIIAGNGPERNKIKSLIIRLGIQKNIKLIRNVPYDIMPELHNLADIMCVPSIPTPSWMEQFGFVFVEAMACGTPVVSTFSGSIPEVVNHNYSGILVNPMDIDDLYNGIERLLTDNLEEWGKRAREYVVKKFNSKLIAKDIADLYKKFI
ncbi:MAG: glycosyltransferase family 4 protein [Candidatus Helarchaeota archaeon]